MKTMIGVVVYILVVILIVIFIRNIIKRIFSKKQNTTIQFLGSMLEIVIIAVSIFILLSQFDATKDISKTILQSSSLIIALLTFSAQQVLGNLVSGISLMATKPFDVGDKIKVISGGNVICEGFVLRMTARHTEIKANDGQVSIVPNSVLDSNIVVNSNTIENIGNYFEVEISYNSDIEKAQTLLLKLMKEISEILINDDIKVLVSRFEASGVVLKTTVWTETLDSNFKACSELRKSILINFPKEGIEIPYTTFTIRSI